MKERKNLTMVVFGVAFVALVIAVVAGLFDAIIVFVDSEHLGIEYKESFNITVGVIELIVSIFGVAFCTFYILEFIMKDRKWLTITQFVSAIVVLVCFIVAFIVLRVKLPYKEEYHYNFSTGESNYGYSFYAQEYTLFVACFNILTNIIITEMIVFVSSFYIKRIKRKELEEEKKAQEQQSVEKQTLEQQSAEQEETI